MLGLAEERKKSGHRPLFRVSMHLRYASFHALRASENWAPLSVVQFNWLGVTSAQLTF